MERMRQKHSLLPRNQIGAKYLSNLAPFICYNLAPFSCYNLAPGSLSTTFHVLSRLRMKSSFELGGYEKEDEVLSPQPRKTKAGMNPITGTVVGEDGKEVAVTMVQMVEKFEKSCKVTLLH